ncbi:MAG: tetratricopeptide repeat protein [Bacteroidia bacterium]
MGKIYFEQSKYDSAAGYFRKVTLSKPKSLEPSFALFNALYIQEKIDEAFQEMFRFLKLTEKPGDYLITLEELAEQIGDAPEDENDEKVLYFYEKYKKQ